MRRRQHILYTTADQCCHRRSGSGFIESELATQIVIADVNVSGQPAGDALLKQVRSQFIERTHSDTRRAPTPNTTDVRCRALERHESGTKEMMGTAAEIVFRPGMRE
jgi:hypothetical protein